MSGTKSTRFFWSDWESDEALKLCSLAAQGLWMRMLCIMAKSDPPGHLMIGGRPLGVEDMRMILGPRKLIGFNLVSLWKELEKHSVFSRNSSGIIVNRRMIRDAKRSEIGRQFAKKKYQATEGTAEISQAPQGASDGSPSGSPDRSPKRSPNGPSGISDSYTYTDSSRSIDGLVEKLVKAADGNVVRGTVGIEMVKPILDLEAQGCDLDADILPTIRERVPKLGEPLRTWGAGFLRDAIMARKADRIRTANGQSSISQCENGNEMIWRRQWDFWKRTGDWPIVWGPDPTASHGCAIPKEFIERWSTEP